MKTTRWQDIKHKGAPKGVATIQREAPEEFYDRLSFAALRKRREQTQVELAEVLGINQASISAIENHTDMLISTLAKYIRAMGGELQLAAVFPDEQFQIHSPALEVESLPVISL